VIIMYVTWIEISDVYGYKDSYCGFIENDKVKPGRWVNHLLYYDTVSLHRRPKYEYFHLNFLQMRLVSYFPWTKQLWYKDMNDTVHLYQWMNLVWLMYHVCSSHSESYTIFKDNRNITHNTICLEYQIICHYEQMVMQNSNEKNRPTRFLE